MQASVAEMLAISVEVLASVAGVLAFDTEVLGFDAEVLELITEVQASVAEVLASVAGVLAFNTEVLAFDDVDVANIVFPLFLFRRPVCFFCEILGYPLKIASIHSKYFSKLKIFKICRRK